jgi:hypothetical protein
MEPRKLCSKPVPFAGVQISHQFSPGNQAIRTALLDYVKSFNKKGVFHTNHATKSFQSESIWASFVFENGSVS